MRAYAYFTLEGVEKGQARLASYLTDEPRLDGDVSLLDAAVANVCEDR